MIKTVTLENFQSHKKTVLDMGKMTVLTGGSNSGKSAVLRALGGLLRNDSVGDYLTHGEKSLKVSVLMDDGFIVEWEKGTGTNQYCIISPDGERDLYQKVGVDIPEEVAKVIGIAPITMEGGQKLHINLHEQLETPFLVGKEHTAGFTAKVFGEVTSAAKLQASIQEGNRLIRADLSKAKLKRSDSEALNEKLLQFMDLPEKKALLSTAEGYFFSASELTKEYSKLESILLEIKEADDKLEPLSETVRQLSPAMKVNLDTVVEKGKYVEHLSELVDSIETVSSKMVRLEMVETLVTKADSQKEIDRLLELVSSQSSLETIVGKIHKYETEEEKLDKLIDKGTKQFDKREKEIELLMAELEDCPTCGQNLSNGAKHHLLGSVAV